MLGVDVHAHVESLLLTQHAHELNSAENNREEGDYMVLILGKQNLFSYFYKRSERSVTVNYC